jgi:3-deoxy-manno-octulosonate cytidylyltransferase (CMP-KDO synthetase)
MRIVAIIPCRFGSKRFEGKPLISILGKPMIQWVYERAKASEVLSEAVVATDDERIRRCVEGFGGHVLMTARYHRCGSDRAAEAAHHLGLEDDDIVVNIQGDQPAFDARSLGEVVSPLMEDQDIVMSTLVFKIDDPVEIQDPNCVKCVFGADGFALYFSRSPVPFGRDRGTAVDVYKHLGIYAFRKSFLDQFAAMPEGRLETLEKLEQLRALEHGYRIKVVKTLFDSKEIDAPSDLQKLESFLGNG